MIKSLTDWLDSRTGYKQLAHEAMYENIPGGSRWIYVTGSMLVFAFVTQLITGVFLAMYYSAGSQNAWESVYMIQHEVQGGWLLRGVHHSMAQGMIVLLPLHLIQVVVCRAYVAPREINYWLGLVLMLITLGLGLTGYLLPWDQKGYWATKVATELAALTPGAGAQVQKLAVGGSEYGHYTLTRFFTLHVMVLPGLLLMVLGAHLAMFRKHGITAESTEKRPDEYFWPKQVFKDAAACLLLLIVVVGFVVWEHGAELGPPAEPTEAYGAARPEWYYLFLFQLLKHAPTEFIGAIVIPGVVMAFLFALPLVAKIKFGHIVNVVVMFALIITAGYLTYEAIYHDGYATNPPAEPEEEKARLLHLERVKGSEDYLLAKHMAELEAKRAVELVRFYGIPKEGLAVGRISDDPEIQGPRIFMRNCVSCHSYTSEVQDLHIPGPRPPRDEHGKLVEGPDPYGAPDLGNFASKEWIMGLLDADEIVSDKYFGLTAHVEGDMVGAVQEDAIANADPKTIEDVAVALSAQAGLVYQTETAEQIKRGTEAMSELGCLECHAMGDLGDPDSAYGPTLTEYGSVEWLKQFIANPEHSNFYPDSNDRMPIFAASDDPKENLLSAHDIDMLVRWIRGDDRVLGAESLPAADESTPAKDDGDDASTAATEDDGDESK